VFGLCFVQQDEIRLFVLQITKLRACGSIAEQSIDPPNPHQMWAFGIDAGRLSENLSECVDASDSHSSARESPIR
jgi:hypothetical protein